MVFAPTGVVSAEGATGLGAGAAGCVGTGAVGPSGSGAFAKGIVLVPMGDAGGAATDGGAVGGAVGGTGTGGAAGGGAVGTGRVSPVGETAGLRGTATTGEVTPLGVTGPESSTGAFRLIRTVSFLSGTVEVAMEGLGGSGSLMQRGGQLLKIRAD